MARVDRWYRSLSGTDRIRIHAARRAQGQALRILCQHLGIPAFR